MCKFNENLDKVWVNGNCKLSANSFTWCLHEVQIWEFNRKDFHSLEQKCIFESEGKKYFPIQYEKLNLNALFVRIVNETSFIIEFAEHEK